MSVTDLIRAHPDRQEVRARLDRFLPPFSRMLGLPTLVVPAFSDSSLVGVAFDYAARMEFAHRAPKAIGRPWIAEQAHEYLRGRARTTAAKTTQAARAAQRRWPAAVPARFDAIAKHAAALAPLDVVSRSRGRSAPVSVPADEQAALVAEVRALLSIAEPLWSLAAAKPLALNPIIGGAAVDGGDADIVAGDLLVDLKVSGEAIVERDQMRQVVAYACLAAQVLVRPYVPIERVAIYLARHGSLQILELLGTPIERAETGIFLMETALGAEMAFSNAGDAIRAAVSTLRAMDRGRRR